MTVYDLCSAYIEGSEKVNIWSIEKEETVFEGTYEDACSSKFYDNEIGSFGIENGIIVINICG